MPAASPCSDDLSACRGETLQAGIGWSECVPDPLDRFLALIVSIDRHDVKATHSVGKLRSLCKEQGSGANQFALFVNIDGEAGA